MRLPFGLGEKNGEELLAIFDIESGSVGAALVSLSPNEQPHIHYTTRKNFTYMDELDFDRFEQAMRAALLDAALALQQEGLPAVAATGQSEQLTAVCCVFSSPWYMSETRLLRRERQRTDTWRTADIEKLAAQCAEEYRGSETAQVGENMDGGPMVIEQNAVTVRLNGYPVQSIAGAHARRIDVAVYLSLIGADVGTHVAEVVNKVFHQDKPALHSSGLAFFTVVRDLYPTLNHFLYVDVGAEITELMLVRDDTPLDTASFPYGIYTAARELGADGSRSVAEGLSQLRLGITNGTPAAEKVRARWRERFADTLAELGSDTALPRNVFLSAPGAYTPWFREGITRESFSTLTFTDETFTVIPLTHKQLQSQYTLAEAATPDVPLAIAALFFDKVRHS